MTYDTEMIISQQQFGVETMIPSENRDLRAVHTKDDKQLF